MYIVVKYGFDNGTRNMAFCRVSVVLSWVFVDLSWVDVWICVVAKYAKAQSLDFTAAFSEGIFSFVFFWLWVSLGCCSMFSNASEGNGGFSSNKPMIYTRLNSFLLKPQQKNTVALLEDEETQQTVCIYGVNSMDDAVQAKTTRLSKTGWLIFAHSRREDAG